MPKKTQGQCLNWTPDKGDPLDYRISDIENVWPEIRIAGPFPRPNRSHYHDEFTDNLSAVVANEKLRKKIRLPRRTFNEERTLELSLWTHVADLICLPPEQVSTLVSGVEQTKRAERSHTRDLLPTRELVTILDYPMDKIAVVSVQPFKRIITMRHNRRHTATRPMMTVGWFLWCVAQAYRYIYAHHEDYGIWGHGISDLCFEGLMLVDNQVELFIGS